MGGLLPGPRLPRPGPRGQRRHRHRLPGGPGAFLRGEHPGQLRRRRRPPAAHRRVQPRRARPPAVRRGLPRVAQRAEVGPHLDRRRRAAHPGRRHREAGARQAGRGARGGLRLPGERAAGRGDRALGPARPRRQPRPVRAAQRGPQDRRVLHRLRAGGPPRRRAPRCGAGGGQARAGDQPALQLQRLLAGEEPHRGLGRDDLRPRTRGVPLAAGAGPRDLQAARRRLRHLHRPLRGQRLPAREPRALLQHGRQRPGAQDARPPARPGQREPPAAGRRGRPAGLRDVRRQQRGARRLRLRGQVAGRDDRRRRHRGRLRGPRHRRLGRARRRRLPRR